MAKQAGVLRITGTIGNVTCYQMNGQYYARMKSSLRSKRVKTSPAFANTMRYANRLAMCSRIASQLYRRLPEGARQVALYRKMTGAAMQLHKAGIGEDNLADALAAIFIPVPAPVIRAIPAIQQRTFAVVTPSGQLAWPLPEESTITVYCRGKSPPGILSCH